MMQSCFGYNFMLVLEKQEKFEGHQQFFAIVQLIGSRKQAENFAYRLVVWILDRFVCESIYYHNEYRMFQKEYFVIPILIS